MFNYDMTRDYTSNLIANIIRYARMYEQQPILGCSSRARELHTLARRVNGVTEQDERNMFA